MESDDEGLVLSPLFYALGAAPNEDAGGCGGLWGEHAASYLAGLCGCGTVASSLDGRFFCGSGRAYAVGAENWGAVVECLAREDVDGDLFVVYGSAVCGADAAGFWALATIFHGLSFTTKPSAAPTDLSSIPFTKVAEKSNAPAA